MEPTNLYLTEDQRAYLLGTCADFEDETAVHSPLEQLADAANAAPTLPTRLTYVYWEEHLVEQPDADDIFEHLVDDWADRGEGEWEHALRQYCDDLAKRDFTDVLRSILLNPENREINQLFLQGAFSCSKMRPGEFGGFSCIVTRKEYCWLNTQHLECDEDGTIKFEPPGIKRFEDVPCATK